MSAFSYQHNEVSLCPSNSQKCGQVLSVMVNNFIVVDADTDTQVDNDGERN